MATFDYAGIKAKALALLEKFGNPLTLTRPNAGATYTPGAGAPTGGTPGSVNGVGVLVGYKAAEVDNEAILSTDRKLIFQGDEVEKGDTYNGYRVHEFNRIDPAESGTIVTIAQMRK